MTIEQMQENVLGMEESFSFGCDQCGKCCRNRKEAVVITGVDFYYLVRATGLEPKNLIQKYLKIQQGHNSKLAVPLLTEREDGSCKFLRKGKCSVHGDKPIVCRLFPLGRMYNPQIGTFQYFVQPNTRCGNSTEITLREWLTEFDIPVHDEECALWGTIAMNSALYMKRARGRSKSTTEDFASAFFVKLFLDLDMSKPCLENLQTAHDYFKKFFKGYGK